MDVNLRCKQARQKRMRHEDAYMMSQIGKLAYKIELRIQIDNEDFMHDTNQYKFKMDG